MTALKLLFVLVFIFAMCYQTNVNCFDESFTLNVSHKYDVSQRQLFDFVTMPQLVDRWMKWLPFFMAADFKPLGVGKHFIVYSNEFQYLIKVTEYQPGQLLALESPVFLRPRIELVFGGSKGDLHSELAIRLSFQRSSALFQQTIGRLYRKVLEPKFVESLQTLNGIMNQMPKTSCCSEDTNMDMRSSICLY